jgi:hypothetical protein
MPCTTTSATSKVPGSGSVADSVPFSGAISMGSSCVDAAAECSVCAKPSGPRTGGSRACPRTRGAGSRDLRACGIRSTRGIRVQG